MRNQRDQRDQREHRKISVPGVNEVTGAQLSTLLSTAASMVPFVIEGAIRVGAEQTSAAMDGGVTAAAASSVIRVFNRIDEILDDPRRWGVDSVLENQTAVAEAVKVQKDLMKTQLAHISRPSTRMAPKLGCLPDGRWVAILEPPDGSFKPIYGTGPDPESALVDFDRAFNATLKVVESIANGPDSSKPPTTGSSDPGPEEIPNRADDARRPKRPRKEKTDSDNQYPSE